MKKILLVDVDSKIPNLALMRLSSFHKSIGNDVKLLRLNFSGYYKKSNRKKIIDAIGFDSVYVSVLFTVNKELFSVKNCDDVYIGGTGFDFTVVLDPCIDLCEPDYSIYPDNHSSFGFITRGCIRNCSFCFVPKKEGKLYEYRDWKSIVCHDRVFFMDNNFLAYPKHKQILKELNDHKIKFSFNQGLDIRLLDEENAELLSQSRYIGEFIFAFDDIHYEKLVNHGIDLFRRFYPSVYREKFYLYCHPNQGLSDVLYRVMWCKQHQVLPYIMRDIECWKSENKSFYVDLASYCNQPQFFKGKTFLQYLIKRYPANKQRVDHSYDLFCKFS